MIFLFRASLFISLPESSDNTSSFVMRSIQVGNTKIPAGKQPPGKRTLISLIQKHYINDLIRQG